jgi:hypothetical protein
VSGAFARHAYGKSRDADQHHDEDHEPPRDLAQIRTEEVLAAPTQAKVPPVSTTFLDGQGRTLCRPSGQ